MLLEPRHKTWLLFILHMGLITISERANRKKINDFQINLPAYKYKIRHMSRKTLKATSHLTVINCLLAVASTHLLEPTDIPCCLSCWNDTIIQSHPVPLRASIALCRRQQRYLADAMRMLQISRSSLTRPIRGKHWPSSQSPYCSMYWTIGNRGRLHRSLHWSRSLAPQPAPSLLSPGW